jgi:hypothetical protein
LLDWKFRRTAWVTVPTVYSKEKWALRKLGPQELGDAMDLSGDKIEGMKAEVLDKVLNGSVPGKLMALVAASLEITESGACAREPHRDRKRKKESEESQARKQTKRSLGAEEYDKAQQRENEALLKTIRQDYETPTESGKAKRSRILNMTKNLEKDQKKSAPVVETIVGDNDDVEANGKQEPKSTVTAKAVKSDDAKVPKYLWNSRVFELESLERMNRFNDKEKEVILDRMRRGLHVTWKRKVEQDFIEWFHSTEHRYNGREDIWTAGIRACVYARRSDWWEWKGGSHIFFWRWPANYKKEALDGVPPYFMVDPPTSMSKQSPYTDEANRKLVKEKVVAVLKTGYIMRASPEEIRSLMFMFDVPKGTDDVRMVYNGSKSGLNDSLWAPWFSLPTVETMTQALLPFYWCADNDYGEQFLNFNLHKELRPYCGVDLSQLLHKEVCEHTGIIIGAWSRNAMGLKPSPYASVKGALRAKRVILGDRSELGNPFHWEKVCTNMPGDENYVATLPWIQKKRRDGHLTTELVQYIDDLRTTAKDKALAWVASSRIAKICCWLGLQDAARKRREPSRSPGAWTGATVSTDCDNTYKSVTEDRWEKTMKRIR